MKSCCPTCHCVRCVDARNGTHHDEGLETGVCTNSLGVANIVQSKHVLEERRGGGSGTQKFVYQNRPYSLFPNTNLSPAPQVQGEGGSRRLWLSAILIILGIES